MEQPNQQRRVAHLSSQAIIPRRAPPMIIASVSLKPLAAASISAGKLRARPSSHRRFAAQRPAGSFSAEHEARLSSHNPTGGSSSIDEASVVDPYGHVADVMSSPARTLTTGLPLEDAIVATTMERYRVSVCAFSRIAPRITDAVRVRIDRAYPSWTLQPGPASVYYRGKTSKRSETSADTPWRT